MKKYWFGKLKRRLTKHRLAVRSLVIASILALFIFVAFATIRPAMTLVSNLVRGPKTAFSLVKDPQGVLRSTKGRTNIVLLGMGGANHQGPELTDSILVVSVDLASTDTVLLSIPRDIWINSLKTKINAIYYYGEQKQEGGGLVLTKAAVEEVIGQSIHYTIAVDFDGFKRAIDLVGGIDVNVPESFDDFKYPIPGMEDAEPEELRYEHLHFEKGLQTMSGEQALKYVRSRNAEGSQGTDFARTQRQQQVLVAFRNKVLSLETLLSPTKIKELAQTFSGSVRTDFSEAEYLSLAKIAIQAKTENLRKGALPVQDEDTGEEGLLVNPSPANYDGQWVLIGKDGSWDKVHSYVEQLFYEKEY
jgi:LCP family protein required for cell wall assembly